MNYYDGNKRFILNLKRKKIKMYKEVVVSHPEKMTLIYNF